MTEIPGRPFNKIAMDLVTECKTSTSGNKHILTIIDHLMGWLEAFPIPDKSADKIVSTFINQYLPVHMYPRDILSDNGTEFKNTLMDQVLNLLGIERIFSVPDHPQSNDKLEVFHKYLKPTLKKLCEKDLSNWDKYINQVLASYRVTPNLVTVETPFLVYGRDPNLLLHQLLEPMQWFLGDPDSGMLNLKAHRLALAITKVLDENLFNTTQKTMDRTPPSFKLGNRVYFKNKWPGKWDLEVETQMQNCPIWVQQTFSAYWKPSHRESPILQHEGCSTWTSSGVLEHGYPIWQSWEKNQQSCKSTYHKSHWLTDNISYTYNTVNNWHSS